MFSSQELRQVLQGALHLLLERVTVGVRRELD